MNSIALCALMCISSQYTRKYSVVQCDKHILLSKNSIMRPLPIKRISHLVLTRTNWSWDSVGR